MHAVVNMYFVVNDMMYMCYMLAWFMICHVLSDGYVNAIVVCMSDLPNYKCL